jgi:hypothetical protein
MTPTETLRAIFVPDGNRRIGHLWSAEGDGNFEALNSLIEDGMVSVSAPDMGGYFFALTAKGAEALKVAP